ncbi:MAG: undecaprenyldiphospho-muramoylpentapeptide beta-N-acetylglucosaminyltransferase [Candidatus Marinimicrobia bacterium]|jgi:UDP-N-acetylglucosamine--N-acetylmuramyl-(pentapeptide) pyrophosphoryl-undecaprenol N-acetylglucosamine transferase|nr:undecaprenyldiphospho-muramoylpentapeptide beta-N-acetylglucosaminyltransferase [Candidatus Neomarinimicrobiota bacterium]MBT3495890.1 undecaprenyldiphospho-muramoylpentapeptide beta-N-acetylglucosaminyltransferase [Candidatus Neomarinimicrobiota bacterium]MBT3692415.1 undecaprenyldiphospho-muramoylpentapeptide beta-N-acetylglucosaminyltransferase [Candidatus Neomarinimicrobiota bacterium]MBT3732932.1 undecaprenyldiphospho-muramoylpentapeptide beta-N-acetylglucosaminyltransferase [Candidatus 
MAKDLRIMIAGGGTGGHLFPALAIGEEIKARNHEAKVHFVGSNFGMESKVFPVKGVWHTLVPIRGFQRGLNLRSIGRNMLLPFRIIRSVLKMKKLIRNFSPQIVVGTGGYASAIPLYVASREKMPVPILLQEQNSFPGITTRWFSKKANAICVAFKDAATALNSSTLITGNPIRAGIADGDKSKAYTQFKLNADQRIIFLFGGSQGSAFLNQQMSKIVQSLVDSNLQILWQTGDLAYNKYKHFDSDKVRVLPFINDMAAAYALSDLIIARSGALTLAEITVCKKPSILVPFPSAAGDHQTKNAQSMVNAGASHILFEKVLNQSDFVRTILGIIKNEKQLEEMSEAAGALGKPNATRDIVDRILEISQ